MPSVLRLARQIYNLQLELAYLRALRAVAKRDSTDALPGIETSIETTEISLRELESSAGSDDVPMVHLAAQVGLTSVEQRLVWTAVAASGDPRFIIPATALVGSDARAALPLSLFSLLSDLDGDVGRSLILRLTSAHPLLRYQLLEAGSESQTVRASPRLAAYLAGETELDPLVAMRGGFVTLPRVRLFDAAQGSARGLLAAGLQTAFAGAEEAEPLVLILEGPAGSGRRTAVASAADRDVLAIDIKRTPPTDAAVEEAVAALRRESLLRGAIPLICHVDDLVDTEGGGRLRAVGRLLDDFPGPVVVTSSRRGLDLGTRRRVLRISWPIPDTATRLALWRHYIGTAGAHLDDQDLAPVALRHVLGAGGIYRAVNTAHQVALSRGEHLRVDVVDLVTGVRNDISDRVGGLARRIDTKQTWKDLVLAPDLMDQVQALIARVRHSHRVYEQWGFGQKMPRGFGVPVLLSGPPGTGKTMLAGIVAAELGLELMQVDLSQVVSKWIGETEKQLSVVFDAAEAGHALLLFDEADALFAKRTEVRGATDRYANLEVNYLLQRVENFSGITILTTNFEAAIDPALKRRLAAHIVFWPPDEDERQDLWQRMLTTGAAPVAAKLDLRKLAREFPDMTGANIRNAVLAAAFLAAAEDTAIAQDHLERAAKGESRTMGRMLR